MVAVWLVAALTAFGADEATASDGDPPDPKTLKRYRRLSRPGGTYGRITTSLQFGRGLRFNNPYRLRTQLGDTAESVSATAPYLDTWLGMAFGDPDGLQHGGALHLSFALEGVQQQAMSASYVMAYGGSRPLLVFGRLGPSLLTAPTGNLGGELAVGAAYFLTGAWGITAELVGNLYYGAGTEVASTTVYPILSGQAGVIADFEVLP